MSLLRPFLELVLVIRIRKTMDCIDDHLGSISLFGCLSLCPVILLNYLVSLISGPFLIDKLLQVFGLNKILQMLLEGLAILS